MKIKKITKIDRGLYGHVCPLCGSILASSSDPDFMPEYSICPCDPDFMPEYSICPCDRKTGAPPAFELFEDQGYVMISRNKFPRFVGRVVMGAYSDIQVIQWLDSCTDPLVIASTMRKAGEFLKKSSK